MCIGVLPACLCEGIVPWNWNCSYELLCGCWELNPGSLKEQPVLLIAESSVQSLITGFSKQDFLAS